MNQAARENILFFLTIANIVAGVVSVALATVAISAIRELARITRKSTETEPSKELVPLRDWHRSTAAFDYPTEVRQPVRRSALIGAEKRLKDDLWG